MSGREIDWSDGIDRFGVGRNTHDPRREVLMFARLVAFVYGVFCYLAFVATSIYAIGFVGDLIVPKSIDSGPEDSLAWALLIDAGLLGIFAVQHSVMARPWFKRAWTRIIT